MYSLSQFKQSTCDSGTNAIQDCFAARHQGTTCGPICTLNAQIRACRRYAAMRGEGEHATRFNKNLAHNAKELPLEYLSQA
jgi:hypothetical protein